MVSRISFHWAAVFLILLTQCLPKPGVVSQPQDNKIQMSSSEINRIAALQKGRVFLDEVKFLDGSGKLQLHLMIGFEFVVGKGVSVTTIALGGELAPLYANDVDRVVAIASPKASGLDGISFALKTGGGPSALNVSYLLNGAQIVRLKASIAGYNAPPSMAKMKVVQGKSNSVSVRPSVMLAATEGIRTQLAALAEKEESDPKIRERLLAVLKERLETLSSLNNETAWDKLLATLKLGRRSPALTEFARLGTFEREMRLRRWIRDARSRIR